MRRMLERGRRQSEGAEKAMERTKLALNGQNWLLPPHGGSRAGCNAEIAADEAKESMHSVVTQLRFRDNHFRASELVFSLESQSSLPEVREKVPECTEGTCHVGHASWEQALECTFEHQHGESQEVYKHH